MNVGRRLAPPGPHGGDAARVAAAVGLDLANMIDLSASMNPFAPDVARLAAALLADASADLLRRYPDPSPATELLASAMGIDPALVVLTNGGAEAIALAAGDVQVGSIVEPEFSLYRRHLARVDATAPRWRSNPSNPLGVLAAPHDEAGLWDEAFYPLSTGRWTRGDSAAWRVGSLTKLWNCAGLRLGYVVAPDAAGAERIRRRQPQWSVNGLALALVPLLLEHTDLEAWSTRIRDLRAEFVERLSALGYDVRSTDANWILVVASDLRARLAAHGVVVRDCGSFSLDHTYRVAIPAPDQFERVVRAFADIAEPA